MSRMRRYRGCGLLNRSIDKLPFEVHIPGYRFCGPGTRLQKRLSRGDIGINPLDESCKQHDIAYDQFSELENRHKADQILTKRAFERVRSSDATLGERLAALAVGSAMKMKVKLGMGACCQHTKLGGGQRKRKLKGKRVKKGGAIPFRKFIRKGWDVIKNTKPINILKAARLALNHVRGLSRRVASPRIIPVPKTGGFLPLIPIFAGLSALGALSGGAAGIAKAVQEAKTAQSQLKEAQRHNASMEAIALGKGLYLKPYRKGLGLYLGRSKKKKVR